MKHLCHIGLLICALGSTSAAASDKPLCDVDFERATAMETFLPQSGKTSACIKDGSLQLAPGAVLTTPMFPYYAGREIFVSVRACSKEFGPKSIATLSVVACNTAGQELARKTVLSLTANRDWKNDSLRTSFEEAPKRFFIEIRFQGDAGTTSFDDLHVRINDPKMQELIGDSGFEGTLNADHWFFYKNGRDWDKLSTWAKGSIAQQDQDIAVTGRSCLKLRGPTSIVSKEFSYHGEKLILSGWMRTKDVTMCPQGWAGAAVQLAGLREDGTEFCHQDMVINSDTHPWEYYWLESSFPSAVKKVRVWIRIFEGASGTAWFDEVRLQRVPSGPPTPFNARQASVAIDTLHPGPTIKHRVWAGVDAHYITWPIRTAGQAQLKLLRQAGFDLIRVREISNGLNIYTRDDEKGNPCYNWEMFDYAFDVLVRQYKLTPIVTIESTPPALDRPGSRKHAFTNRFPPNDFEKWGRFIEAIFDHAIDRYGQAEVETWLWEIWNEPSFTGIYYFGTQEDFLKLAEQVYLAADRVEKRRGVNLKMGLTSGGEGNIEMLKNLQRLGKLDLIDHYSVHIYAGVMSSIRTFQEVAASMDDYRKQFPQLKPYLKGCTEWNGTSTGGESQALPWNASFVVKAIRLMLDGGLDYATYFDLSDNPEANNLPDSIFVFGGQMGLFTRGDVPVPKPAYNAFVFLNELKGGKRLKLQSSNDPIDGVAVQMPDGTIRIVLTNYDEDISRQPYSTKVTVTLSEDQKSYRCTRLWAADDTHGNTYKKWIELNRPAITDTRAAQAIVDAGKPGVLVPPTIEVRQTGPTCVIDVPSPGIRFIEFQPISKNVNP